MKNQNNTKPRINALQQHLQFSAVYFHLCHEQRDHFIIKLTSERVDTFSLTKCVRKSTKKPVHTE